MQIERDGASASRNVADGKRCLLAIAIEGFGCSLATKSSSSTLGTEESLCDITIRCDGSVRTEDVLFVESGSAIIVDVASSVGRVDSVNKQTRTRKTLVETFLFAIFHYEVFIASYWFDFISNVFFAAATYGIQGVGTSFGNLWYFVNPFTVAILGVGCHVLCYELIV